MPSARGDRSFFLLAQIKKIRALLLIFYRDLDMLNVLLWWLVLVCIKYISTLLDPSFFACSG